MGGGQAVKTPPDLTGMHTWFNGQGWMASAQIGGHFCQVVGPHLDPEIALIAVLKECEARRGDPAERPSTGKPKNPWDDDDL